MSQETNTILVRNLTKRNFNGVRPFQIVSILEENKFMYLNAGFEEYTGVTEEVAEGGSEDGAEGTSQVDVTADLEARKLFLSKNGIDPSKWGDKRIVKESDKIGYDANAQTEVTAATIEGAEAIDPNNAETSEQSEETEEVAEVA